MATRAALAPDGLRGYGWPTCAAHLLSCPYALCVRQLPSRDERRAHVLAFLGSSFNDTAAAAALSIVEHNWADEPYSRGATTFFPPGAIDSFWPAWSRLADERNGSSAMGRLWIAGADYDAQALGRIDGAIGSGQDVAHRILRLQGRP